MKANAGCSCQAAPKLIFPRSGASDISELTDQAARQMTRAGAGKLKLSPEQIANACKLGECK